MKQAIAGVTVPEDREATVMTVWPSVAAMSLGGLPLGTILGRLYEIPVGFHVFTLGNLFCLLSIPLSIARYFNRTGPFVATRYRLTIRRVLVETGLMGQESKSLGLDQFDAIEIVVRPGQAWYDAGDLVFWQGKTEKFLLEGVSRPDAFRHVCMKAHQGFVGVQAAMR